MKRIAASIAVVGLLLTACGGDSGPDPEADPKAALTSAFENLANSDGIAVELSLDATAESLNSLAADGGEAPDEETAQKILDSRLRILTKGKGEEAQLELVATVAGEEDLELKVVDQVVYFRADAEGLTETFGGNPAELRMMAEQAKAQGLDFVEPALGGEWISITGAQDLSGQLGGATDANKMAENQEKLIREMSAALEKNATVTHAGSDDIGEHLSVSVPLRDIYQSLLSGTQGLPGLPAGGLPPQGEVPDESIVMDVWVADDFVRQAGLDFTQFAKLEGGAEATGGPVVLLMSFDEFDDEIEAPDSAVEVPAEQLMQMFMGSMGLGAAPGPAESGNDG